MCVDDSVVSPAQCMVSCYYIPPIRIAVYTYTYLCTPVILYTEGFSPWNVFQLCAATAISGKQVRHIAQMCTDGRVQCNSDTIKHRIIVLINIIKDIAN